jgi:hypothetical protein
LRASSGMSVQQTFKHTYKKIFPTDLRASGVLQKKG